MIGIHHAPYTALFNPKKVDLTIPPKQMNLHGWMSSSDLGVAYTNGQGITTALNKGTIGGNFVRDVYTTPTFVTNQLGSIPAVRFDGSDNGLQATTGNWNYISNSDSTAYFVIKKNSGGSTIYAGTTRGIFSGALYYNSGGSPGIGMIVIDTNNATALNTITGSSDLSTTSFDLVCIRFRMSGAPNCQILVDGVSKATGNLTGNGNHLATTYLNIGRAQSGFPAAFDAIEMMFYEGYHDDNDVIDVKNFLEYRLSHTFY